MSKTNLESVMETLKAIPANEVKTPGIPVSVYVQEAEDQYVWAQHDKEVLLAHGLQPEFLETLPERTGACREAQSQWMAEYKSREEAEREWLEKAPQAFELRDDLLTAFRYAFRKRSDLLNKVAMIAEGNSREDMIQDLNDSAVLGRENEALLTAIKFDLTKLDTAAETSDSMGNLLALTKSERNEIDEELDMRDRSYTYLKEAIDEIRACGKYAFAKDPERVIGYRSEYIHKMNIKNSSNTTL